MTAQIIQFETKADRLWREYAEKRIRWDVSGAEADKIASDAALDAFRREYLTPAEYAEFILGGRGVTA